MIIGVLILFFINFFDRRVNARLVIRSLIFSLTDYACLTTLLSLRLHCLLLFLLQMLLLVLLILIDTLLVFIPWDHLKLNLLILKSLQVGVAGLLAI